MAYLLNCIKWRRKGSMLHQPTIDTLTAYTLKSKKHQNDLVFKPKMPLRTMKKNLGRALRSVNPTSFSKRSKDKKASHKNKTKAAKADRKYRKIPSVRDLHKVFENSSLEIIEYGEEPGPQRPPVDHSVADLAVPEAAPAQQNQNDVVSSPDVTNDAPSTQPETGRKRKAYRWYFKPRNGDIFIVEYLHQNFNTPRHLRFIDVPNTKDEDPRSQEAHRNYTTCYNDCLTNELIRSGAAVAGSAGFVGKATSFVCSCCSETVSVAFKMSCYAGRNSTWKGGYICESCLYCVQNESNRHRWLLTDL